MQASEITSRKEFQFANANGENSESFEPVIQNVWSQKQSGESSESTGSMSATSDKEPHFTFPYERASMLAVQASSSGTRIVTTDGSKISYVHIAPKVEARRLSYTGSIPENSGSSPSNSPEALGVSGTHLYGENSSPIKVGFHCVYLQIFVAQNATFTSHSKSALCDVCLLL